MIRFERRGGQQRHPASKLPPPLAAPHRHPANIARHDQMTNTERRIETFVKNFGSLRFLFWQTVVIAVWITINLVGVGLRWDPYPFILLNLVFSTQAAYAAPLILLAQNRETEHDRVRAECDYDVNQRDARVNRAALQQIQQNTELTKASAARIEKIVAHLGIEETP